MKVLCDLKEAILRRGEYGLIIEEIDGFVGSKRYTQFVRNLCVTKEDDKFTITYEETEWYPMYFGDEVPYTVYEDLDDGVYGKGGVVEVERKPHWWSKPKKIITSSRGYLLLKREDNVKPKTIEHYGSVTLHVKD